MKWVFALLLFFLPQSAGLTQKPEWPRHTIDDSSQGADGVRLEDLNGDGCLDVVTGWEQGGVVRVYINPGVAKSKEPWPAVSVGAAASVEDAVMVDVDGDGCIDVVSSTEGDDRSVRCHWGPERSRVFEPEAWTSEVFPQTVGAAQWMFCVPAQVDGKRGIDLVLGSKNQGAGVHLLVSPENPRDLSAWKLKRIYEGGWIMSIQWSDMDGDGDGDVLLTDRKGPGRGCLWLENPGAGEWDSVWETRRIGGEDREVMFLGSGDLDRDGLEDLVVSARESPMLWFKRLSRDGMEWERREAPYPLDAGTGKGIAIADVDRDGVEDVILSCEHARGKVGVQWLKRDSSSLSGHYTAHGMSGLEGTKFDLVELIDLDGDQDLDVLTCEESENLGVIWFENPTVSKVSSRED